MTDLTYCYLHMTRNDLLVLDTVETAEYIPGELSDEELDIPPHMVPPNPDDTDMLPSQIHPSYPYGNPTQLKHPSTKPRHVFDPSSRALFEDMGITGGGMLKWADLGLDDLLPVDEEKEEAKRAAQARKMASGASNHNPQGQQQTQQTPQAPQGPLEDDEDDDDDDELDENNNDDLDEDLDEDEDEDLSEGDDD